MQVWRYSDHQAVARIPHEESINTLAFRPDGDYIESGGDDKRVLFSSLNLIHCVISPALHFAMNVTAEECATYSERTPNPRPCPGIP